MTHIRGKPWRGIPWKDEAVALRAAGATNAEIGRRVGVSRQRVIRVIGPKGKRSDAFMTRVRFLWDEGYTIKAIADEMGVTPGVIGGISYRGEFPGRHVPMRHVVSAEHANG